MKRLILFFAISVMAVFESCTSHKKDSADVVYNQYVDAFTSSKISKNESVMVKLSTSVNANLQNSGEWEKYFSISPSTRGDFTLQENGSLLIFTPDKLLKSNTTYTVKLDLGKLIGASAPDDKFTFSFSVKEWGAKASFREPNIDPDNADCYQLQLTVTTNGFETAKDVENCGSFDGSYSKVAWTHSPDGKTHTAIISGIKPKNYNYDFTYEYTVDGKGEKAKLNKTIPASENFEVWQCSLVTDNGRYIEVAFNKKIKQSQDIKGLVYIVGYESTPYEIDINKIRFYYDQSVKGELSVFISSNLCSQDGKKLQSDKIFKIDLGGDKPELEFIKTGSLVPMSDKIMIPFKATYYRGAIVRVVKIKEKNIAQFLQINSLSGGKELKRVGRLVARKTIFFDDENLNLSNTHSYALNLSDLIVPEPGAIYRVTLSVDKSFSTYPGVNETFGSKEGILFNDKYDEESEASNYDYPSNYSYYYYDDDEYEYYRSSDPTSDSYYRNRSYSINVLATNLGIVVKAGSAKSLKVSVNNLVTTDPESDVDLKVYNYQNEVIGSGKTNADGMADIDYSRSRPFLIVASKDNQRTYMRIDAGSALSVSDFNVGGEVLKKGIKGFIYGERGVWRPGDTLHLSFMLNNRQDDAPANMPVTLSLYTPLGQLYFTKTSSAGSYGLYAFNIPTDADAVTGEWSASVNVGGVIFNKAIRIETVKPNRLKIKLDLDELMTDKSTAKMHGEWLNGNPVNNLKYDIVPSFSSISTSFKGYDEYKFVDAMNNFSSETASMIEGKLDSAGNASINFKFDISKKAPGKLLLRLSTKMYEPSGDFSINGASSIYSPFAHYIGIKSPEPDNKHGWYNTGSAKQKFSIVSLDENGKAVPSVECIVNIYKLRYWWWWDSEDGSVAEYVNDKYLEPVQKKTVVTGSNGLAEFAFGANDDEWGAYYIRVTDVKGGHSTGDRVYFDWPLGKPRQLENGSSAIALPMSVDKEKYEPGETAMLSFNAEVGSVAILSIENGAKVISVSRHKITEENTSIPVEVTSDMTPNVYLHVTLIQPYARTENDLPIRLYGIVPLTVDDPASHLHPVIGVKDEIRSEDWYSIDVNEENGRPMAYSLAVVDEGLLDLTNFKTPEPWKAFNGKEALGVDTWDIYNNVLGAYGGKIEQLFSIGGGGSEDDAKGKGLVNRFRPVVEFIGPITLDKNSTNTHKFFMPNYTGKVRVMVIATDGKAYGNTDKSVAVKKPLLVIGTLPRMLGCDEDVIVPATIFATKSGIGNVKASIEVSDGLEIIGDKQKTVVLNSVGDKTVNFHIKTSTMATKGVVKIKCEAKGETASYGTEILVQNREFEVGKTNGFVLEPGKSIEVTPESFGIAGTNNLDIEATTALPMNLNGRLNSLIAYPHGCIEQTTSKVFAQLLLSDVCDLSKAKSLEVQVNVQTGINKYRSFLTSQGGLAYWPGNREPDKWGSIYAMHCLTVAEAMGYRLPDGMKASLLKYLKRIADDRYSYSRYYQYSQETTLAYCLYVLALNNQPDLGTMNWMLEKNDVNGVAMRLLAGAYALTGRISTAQKLMADATDASVYSSYDWTYGSNDRNKAITAMVLTDMNELSDVMPYLKDISDCLSSDNWLSTQSTAFCLFAVSHFYQKAGKPKAVNFKYKYNGKGETVNDGKSIAWTSRLDEKADNFKKIEIANEGESSLFVKLRESGIPARCEVEECHKNISVSVQYANDGVFAEYRNLHQGTNFQATVSVTNLTDFNIRNIAIEQYIPSGWEILNDRFVDGFDGFDNTLSHQDIRDDRVYSYIDHLTAKATVIFTVKLCATYPGTFYLPPIKAYAMYDNETQANTRSYNVVVSE